VQCSWMEGIGMGLHLGIDRTPNRVQILRG
jgi:hypothetical protein